LDLNYKFLLESGKIPIQISKLGLYYYLSVHYVPGDMCIIKNVKKLLPGHYLEFDMDQFNFKLVKYWDLEEQNFEGKIGLRECSSFTGNSSD